MPTVLTPPPRDEVEAIGAVFLLSVAHGRLLDAAASLSPDDVRSPTLLDGWTVAHLLTHLSRNADAIRGMLDGVARDAIVPMYPGGAAQRDGDIDDGSVRYLAAILEDLHSATVALDARIAATPLGSWTSEVQTRTGRLKAWQLVWLRWREVEIHMADLGRGARMSEAFTARALFELVETAPDRLQNFAAVELCTDAIPLATLRGPGSVRLILDGSPTDLVLWLTGRAALAPW